MRTKRCVCILFVLLLVFCTPGVTAQAKEIDSQTDFVEKVFMTYDEFLQLYRLSSSGKLFYLKSKFEPYFEKIAVDRFASKLCRIEGEYFKARLKGYKEKVDVPLYEIGDLYIKADPRIPEEYNLITKFQYQVAKNIAYGIIDIYNIEYNYISTSQMLEGKYAYLLIFIHTSPTEFDFEKDVAIAVRYTLHYNYDDCADYTYLTEDEYYEKYSGKSAKPTATPTPSPSPEPTATPTPSPKPTATPTPSPSPEPTATPTPSPSPEPTATPTPSPSPEPTATPTPSPSPEPTATPTPSPEPTATSTPSPSPEPTATPTPVPTLEPTPVPASADNDINSTAVVVIAVVIALGLAGVVTVIAIKRKKK